MSMKSQRSTWWLMGRPPRGNVDRPIGKGGSNRTFLLSRCPPMSPLVVVQERLASQRLVGPQHARPADAVEWLGAVQAQDYRGSLWGGGLRTRGATELGVERAIAEHAIVRTWPMRGTLHLVASKE